MQLGVALDHRDWARGRSSQGTLDLAGRLDRAGLDALWLSEDPDGWDAFGLLGALTQVTERIQLGTAVTNPYLRHPNLIAASAATIDRLAPGRLLLGLGRGQPEWYERALGMDIGQPLRRLEETIELLHAWWQPPGRASMDGEFRIRDWTRVVRPRTSPPIYVAAAGPKALDLAGRMADGVIFNMLATPDYIEGAIVRVRQAATRSGRDPSMLTFVANPGVVVTDDPAPVLERRKRFVANVLALPGMEALLEHPNLDVAEIMAEVRRHMNTGQILARGGAFADFERDGDIDAAVAIIPDELVDRGSAVGPLDHVRARVATFASIGVTQVLVAPHGLPTEVDELRQTIESLRS